MNDAANPGARRARRALVAAAWLAALGLVACGPGVGGSGTGLEPGPTPATPIDVRFSDDIDGTRVQARLLGDRLLVRAPCLGIDFDGVRGAPSRFDGLLGADPTRPVQAEAELAGSTLLLTLRDGTGRVLLGPQLLVRNDTPPALAGCG